jgi:hypothetical protein
MAVGETIAATVNVTVPPGSTLTGWSMAPLPSAEQQLDPLVAEQVQVTCRSADGNASVTRAAYAVVGPALPTWIQYVSGLPPSTIVTPSVFVIERSA